MHRIDIGCLKEFVDETKALRKSMEDMQKSMEETSRAFDAGWSGDVREAAREEERELIREQEETIRCLSGVEGVLTSALDEAALLQERCGDFERILAGGEPVYGWGARHTGDRYEGIISMNEDVAGDLIAACRNAAEEAGEIEKLLPQIESLVGSLEYEPLDISREVEEIREGCRKVRRLEEYGEAYRSYAEGFISLNEGLARDLAPYTIRPVGTGGAVGGVAQERLSTAEKVLASQVTEGIRQTMEMSGEVLDKAKEMKYLFKYVNEETLCLINLRWGDNKERFKEVYGENVYVELRECMYRYGITDEVSILMFLSTMGVETGYGAHVLQGNGWEELENAEYRESLEEVPVIDDKTGVGLLQVTNAAQRDFIRDKYESLEEGSPERERMEEYFGISEGYFSQYKRGDSPELENAAGYIYRYYPIEASVWFWAGYGTKCATFDGPENQTDYTINDYIPLFKDKDLDNLYLGIQYTVNSMPPAKEGNNIYMRKGDVEDICEAEDALADQETKEIEINGKTFPMPNGWANRMGDWDNAKKLLEEGQPKASEGNSSDEGCEKETFFD